MNENAEVQTILSVLGWCLHRAGEGDDPSFSELLAFQEKLLGSGEGEISENDAALAARVIRWALQRSGQWGDAPFGGFLAGWSAEACENKLNRMYALLRERF